MSNQKPRSVRFRNERQESWSELEDLVVKIDRGGLADLSAEELTRLPMLYRAAVSSLNHARNISIDANLLKYLETLCGRTYLILYGPRKNFMELMFEFFRVTFPSSVRALGPYIALSSLMLFGGVFAGWYLVLQDITFFYSFVSEAYAQSRGPSSTPEELRSVLYDSGDPDDLAVFASFLVSNNAKIGMNCFALGFAGGVPVIFLLLYNGLVIGAFMALYQTNALGLEFIAWILPHGVTELFAVILCGASGLLLGKSIVWPGKWTRTESLRIHMKTAGPVVLGAVIMFFVAAIIEGFFRQLVHDVPTRWLFTLSSIAFWIVYLLWRRR